MACSRPFMAIHPLSAATVNGRRYAPPKPEMTASTIIRRNPVYPRSFPHRWSACLHAAAAAHHQSGQTGTGWSLQRARPVRHSWYFLGSSKTPRITAPDCSPDVMVADVPMYPRIVSSAQAMAASNRLSKSATAPPVIATLARPRSVISAATPAETRNAVPGSTNATASSRVA